MVAKVHAKVDVSTHAEVKQRVNTALIRYEAFGAGVKRGDKSAQASGVKILESLASLAAQEALKLRNSPELRRFFAAAVNRVDVAALVRSRATHVQLSALRASNTLAHTPDALTASILPCIIELLAVPGDGGGSQKLLAIVEAASEGIGSASAHLQLLQTLLNSSTVAQRQLLGDAAVAKRWASSIMRLLQRGPTDMEQLAVSSVLLTMTHHMQAFVSILELDCSLQNTLLRATSSALQAGCRAGWRELDQSAPQYTNIACNLLDVLAIITPPHVRLSMACHPQAGTSAPPDGIKADAVLAGSVDTEAMYQLGSVMDVVIMDRAASAGPASKKRRVLSAVLRTACVLLLPPLHNFGSTVSVSPWFTRFGANLPAKLLQLASRRNGDKSITAWCWQALYLLQPELTDSQRQQILDGGAVTEVPAVARQSEPQYSHCIALQLFLACYTALRQSSADSGHPHTAPGHIHPAPGRDEAAEWPPHTVMKHSQAATGQSQAWMEQLQADQTNAGCPHAASHTQQLSHVHQPPHLVHTDSSQLSRQTLLYIRISLQKTFELRLSHIQSHRLDFNIMSSDQLWLFSLTSEAVSVLGWKHVPTEPWTTAWLILMRAVDKFYSRGCPAYGAAVVASLRALAEAGKMQDWNVPSLLQMQQELHASICRGSVKRMEVAYSEGSNVTNIPAPLCQHGDTQLQLWWAVATAACCNQLGLPSSLGDSCKALLDNPTAADVAFELPTSSQVLWAHASVIAARCPKLHNTIQSARQSQASHTQSDSANSDAVKPTRMTTVRLGKQVYVESFQQVLQYIYTGQVEVAGDRTPLRKLAQALGLKQLAMLASGALPVPGAVYSAFSLVELFTQQAVTISHSAVRCSLQLPSTNAQGCSHEEQHRPSQQHGQNYSSSTSSARVHDSSDSNIVADDGVYSKVHPALEDLSAAVTDSHAPRRLPIPADVPSHADILLVPSQTNAGSLVQQLGHMPQSLPGQRPAYHSKATHHAGGALLPQQTPTANNADAQNSLVGLAAHAAVLIAASPYFAAMLSDRWQERVGDDGAQEGRHLTATYLPNHDFEVVLCFLYFCYTHELSLSLGHSAPSQGASECDNISHELTLRTPDSVCPKCQQARTAIRLCAAAEEWIVPDLQQQCWQYVKGVQQRLPAECRDVLLCDMAQLHQWDLAAQCT